MRDDLFADAISGIQRAAMVIAEAPRSERDAMFAATRQLYVEAGAEANLDNETADRWVNSTMECIRALVNRLDFVGSKRA